MYQGRQYIQWYPVFDNWLEKAHRRSGRKHINRSEIVRQALRDWDAAIQLGRHDTPEEIHSINLHYVAGRLETPKMKHTVMSLGAEFEPICERLAEHLHKSGVHIARLYHDGVANTSIICVFALYRAAYRDLTRLNLALEPARIRAPRLPR